MSDLPFHIKKFNEKVRILNQTSAKQVILTPEEARSLHAEIYDLMATISNLTKAQTTQPTVTNISMDGGSFK
jgi:hypothetical protein